MPRSFFSNFSFFKSKRENALRRIKKLPKVKIGADFVMGEGSDFNLEYKFKELSIAENVSCRKFCNFYLHSDASLIIQKNVFFNNYCSINSLGFIEIGENSIFGEGVKIYDHNHRHHSDGEKLTVDRNNFDIGRVTIGKNCWIGSNVTILNNISIGDNVIIGANCLIYKSIPSNCIVKAKVELAIEQR